MNANIIVDVYVPVINYILPLYGIVSTVYIMSRRIYIHRTNINYCNFVVNNVPQETGYGTLLRELKSGVYRAHSDTNGIDGCSGGVANVC